MGSPRASGAGASSGLPPMSERQLFAVIQERSSRCRIFMEPGRFSCRVWLCDDTYIHWAEKRAARWPYRKKLGISGSVTEVL
ncbi:hypothetical protein FKM82_015506 [Ascaphus truei]